MVLSSLGIILGGLLLAPMVTFLDYHSYYVTQFVTAEREAGRTMDDDLVPHVAFFSKMFFVFFARTEPASRRAKPHCRK